MGRRPSGALPQMRRHKPTNTARITLGDKVYSLGRWGSHEARDRLDTLTAVVVEEHAKGCRLHVSVAVWPPLRPCEARALAESCPEYVAGTFGVES